MFGILEKDGHHVQTAEATNSRTFVDFLKWVRLKYQNSWLVLDNASYHKSGTVMDYLAYVNGDIRLVFLPPYTPQLNPTEILWRGDQAAVVCRYFESEEDLERAIMEIVGGGEPEVRQNNGLLGCLRYRLRQTVRMFLADVRAVR